MEGLWVLLSTYGRFCHEQQQVNSKALADFLLLLYSTYKNDVTNIDSKNNKAVKETYMCAVPGGSVGVPLLSMSDTIHICLTDELREYVDSPLNHMPVDYYIEQLCTRNMVTAVLRNSFQAAVNIFKKEVLHG